MSDSQLVFRVDAGGEIGLGHFYRSWSLAKKMKLLGYNIVFVHLKSFFWNEISDFEFDHFGFDKDVIHKKTVEFCNENQVKVLYVDGIIDYSSQDLSGLLDKTKIVFYQNYGIGKEFSDVFILPVISKEKEFYEPFEDKETIIFSGLNYFLYNEIIQDIPVKVIEPTKDNFKVGIIAGGSDPNNVLLKLFSLLNQSVDSLIDYTFYYGSNYVFKENIPKTLPHNIAFESFDHHEILKNDALVSSFGVSTYEFMVLGMPIISFGHQQSNANASKLLCEKTNAIVDLGNIELLSMEVLLENINILKDNIEYRKVLSERSQNTLDRNGFERVIEIITNYTK
ncbi:hypothetical protein [Nonlabens sp. Asnod3-A02]|uniref:hypothetical protein n=1 Tax=Nonlabens sp. Asnod3-A02 TaxID=3160579 RepID=UPI003864D56B